MRIHFVGISGVSMQALADAAAARGHIVTGSDNTLCGHDPKNVESADLVVYTCAVPPTNCELCRAKELKIPTIERAVYLGELAATYGKVIAIAGCHGKSTTTAMTGAAFGGHSPTVHVGVAGGSTVGSDRFFITEACEYKSNFLHLKPDIGVVLNVGYDHPDYYRTEEQLINAYRQFCAKSKTVIVNGDDKACLSLCGNPITFGTGEKCDYRAVEIKSENGYRSFRLVGKRQAYVRLSVAGEHNVYNALAAIAAADSCGVKLNDALPRIAKFTGIARRFERKGIAFNKSVFTDYAHHPDEISATIKTAKEIFPSVAVVFQPHTYTRTKSLMDDFAEALSGADTVILAPIFSARENPIAGVTSHALCRKIVEKKEKAYCFDTFAEIVEHTKAVRESAVIFMGAGDIAAAADLFIKADKDLPSI
ncbi:MAG: UDP-N-acetylmuramate--L-alanine ligase [Clostridiales bacterium]|nr:UDP-N-acetylmuramate--L-alanine ligase [Clostridiales bacterium]